MTTETIEELKISNAPDGGVIVGGEPPEEAQDEDKEGKDEDERVSQSADNHDEEEQGHAAETAEEAEARRERNRQRRKDNKDRRKEYVESLKRELASRDALLNEVNQRLAVVERRSSGSEMAQLDNAEKEAVKYYNQFKEIHAQAVEQANGAVAADATEKMLMARQRVEQINNIKRAYQQKQSQPAPLDPRLVTHAQDWLSKNSWYDPQGNDNDSSIVLALDNRLAKEGWNPTTPEYWQELDARVKKHLPHRIVSSYNNSQGNRQSQSQMRSPVAGSGRESVGAKSTGYKLSPERVQAMKDSGVWDDPSERAKMIKYYQTYDRTQGAN